MSCDLIRSALGDLGACTETTEGSRLTTHCLYPSFEPVYVFVAKVGEGYRVHDGGGAFQSAWLHGRDEPLIRRTLDAECRRFQAKHVGNAIEVAVDSLDWLASAILTVANASSLAAHAAVARVVAASERVLIDEIQRLLTKEFGEKSVGREVEVLGKSGGKRRFDVVVSRSRDEIILVNGVSPHHSSIYSKYVSFSDADASLGNKFAVFDRAMGASDVSLLQQVAQIVSFTSLKNKAHRVLSHAQ